MICSRSGRGLMRITDDDDVIGVPPGMRRHLSFCFQSKWRISQKAKGMRLMGWALVQRCQFIDNSQLFIMHLFITYKISQVIYL